MKFTIIALSLSTSFAIFTGVSVSNKIEQQRQFKNELSRINTEQTCIDHLVYQRGLALRDASYQCRGYESAYFENNK